MTYQELINNIRDLGFSDDSEMEDFGELVPNSINRAITEINYEVDPIIGKLEIEIKDSDSGFLYIDMADITTQRFECDGETVSFETDTPIRFVTAVTLVHAGEEQIVTSGYSFVDNIITFATAPDDGDVLNVSYTTYGDPGFMEFTDVPILFRRVTGQDTDNPITSDFYTRFNNYEIESNRIMVINADENKGFFRIFYKKAHTDFENTQEDLQIELPLNLRVHHLVPLLASYYVWLEDEPSKAAQYYNLYEQKKTEIEARTNKPKIKVLEGGI